MFLHLTSYLAPRLTGSVQVLGILPRMPPEKLEFMRSNTTIRSLVLQLNTLGGWSKEDKKNGISATTKNYYSTYPCSYYLFIEEKTFQVWGQSDNISSFLSRQVSPKSDIELPNKLV